MKATKAMNFSKMAGALMTAFLTLFSVSVFAQAGTKTATTVKGEVLDMNCYMDHGAHGADHKGCAKVCINGGAPMGLLTSSGKVYLLVQNHDKPDPYASLKKYAGEQVEVSGTVQDRGGVQGLIVGDVKGKM